MGESRVGWPRNRPTIEQDRELRVQDPRVGAETHPPLLQDDAALLVDLVRVEGHRVRPVLEDQQRPVDDARIVGGNLQLVDRLIEARIGVDVRSEAHPGRLEKRDDFLLREVTRAVEAHVLHEVREPALIVLFENRSCVDDEPELGPGLRILVGTHVVPHPVGERADRDPRIDGNGLSEWRVVSAGCDGALRRRHHAGRGGNGQRQKHQVCAGAEVHPGHSREISFHIARRGPLPLRSRGVQARVPPTLARLVPPPVPNARYPPLSDRLDRAVRKPTASRSQESSLA